MLRSREALATFLVFVLAGGSAGADGPAGNDPRSNIPIGAEPAACESSPTGPECIAAAVQYLDQSRADLGQPPYQLPSNFIGLAPDAQALVLTNLDRLAYGLPALEGVVSDLDRDASRGVRNDNDPDPSSQHVDAYTSNWAGDYPNIVYAYGAWMYDDGPGSGNADCPNAQASGCWEHRHDVLWRFDGKGRLALGASSGSDSRGHRGFALLLVQGDARYRPTYTYTWSHAVDDGAGGASSSDSPPPVPPLPAPTPAPAPPASTPAPRGIHLAFLRVQGHAISFRVIAPPGARLRCALSRRTGERFSAPRFRSCRVSAAYRHLRRGSYRLEIMTAGASLTRYARIR